METEQYKLTCPDELMEFMWLKPGVTGLNVDIFVDDGMSYERNNHVLLLFIRNGNDKTANSFIPMSVSDKPCVLDGEMDLNISHDDILAVQDFIRSNLSDLIALSWGGISQEDFCQKISSLKCL